MPIAVAGGSGAVRWTPPSWAVRARRRRVSINWKRFRLCGFGLVLVIALIVAAAPWGRAAAVRAEVALQLGVGVMTLACGVYSAARVRGASRWWRLSGMASLVCWLLTVILRLSGGGVSDRIVDVIVIAAFVLCPLFALSALVTLGRLGGADPGLRSGLLRPWTAITVLDGLVASLAYLALAAMGGFVQALFESPNTASVVLQVLLMVVELGLVATAVVQMLVYRLDRPFRDNYLFLAAGIVTQAASYRVGVYLQYIGADGATPWANFGFVLGSLLTAYAMLETTQRQPDGDESSVRTDWVRLVLPYAGFVGIALLFTFHVITGRPLGLIAVAATLLMVVLVTVRQVVAMRAQWQLARRLYWALSHDPLTGLPNRILFAERLDEAARDRRFVLIFIDLDDFKDVNDRYGHAAGDALLCAVGDRLKMCVTDQDTLARIGGDEFAILLRGEGELTETAADRLRSTLRAPFHVHGSSVRVRASIGVVGPGARGFNETSDDLLRHAVVSMSAGKQLGKDRVVVYQASTGTRVDFPIALREANGCAPDGFHLVFQPVVQLPSGTPIAVEALARWTAPNGMAVSPETFVGAAEAAGLGAVLDHLVLDMACRAVADAGLTLDVHVNVGAARLGVPGFDEKVRRTLAKHRIEPSRLVIEITETVPIVDIPDAAAQIRRLDTLGVRVALDDFGTGYNSLTYLHSLPIHIVKLDRSFAVGSDPGHDLALYRSVLRLCADLGLQVVAEGIETDAQAVTIAAAGCTQAQGHLYGRPAPIGALSPQRQVASRR